MSGHPGPLLYNPALLSREELIGSFLVRQEELGEIVGRVRAATPGHAPQHLLILGFRGMGKTTLLHRTAYAVEDDADLSADWLPVLFDEEQFNVGELADFWLNALEMLSHAADRPELLRQAEELPTRYRDDALEEAAYETLRAAAHDLDRRLLLLVDNVDLVLDRIDPDREASRLREVLQHQPWLMLVGTSSRAIESTYDYGQPFYEMFKVVELAPMTDGETLSMLAGLAERYAAPDVADLVAERPGKVAKIQTLMGGNPRTVALLFGVLQEGPDGDLWTHLERLLDGCTSLYKDRLESLPVQSQRVFDALAQHWHPATAEILAERLRLGRGAVSGQLHRLVDKGLVEKVKLPGRAIGFQVRERFFNIWCLMRGGRRSRQNLRWLVEFIDLFYDDTRLKAEAERIGEALGTGGDDSRAERRLHYVEILITRLERPAEKARLLEAALDANGRLHQITHGIDTTIIREVVLDDDLPANAAIQLIEKIRTDGLSDEEIDWRRIHLLKASPGMSAERLRDTLLTELKALTRKDSVAPTALQIVSYLQFLVGEHEEALRLATRATKADPSSVYAWDVLGNAHLARGGFEEARNAFEQGLNARPRDAGLWASLLVLQMSGGTGPGVLSLLRDSTLEMRDSGLYLPTAELGLAVTAAINLEREPQASIDQIAVGHFLKMASPILTTSELMMLAALAAVLTDLQSLLRHYVQVSGKRELFQSFEDSLVVDLIWNIRSIIGPERAQGAIEQLVRCAFTEFDPISSEGQGIRSLANLLLVVHPENALELLSETGWDEALTPLCHALAVHAGQDSKRLALLAPELRNTSEIVLECLEGASLAWHDHGERSEHGNEP